MVREAEKESCDCAVVPIENSTAGAVGAALDALMETPLVIRGETTLRIRHNLLAREKRAPAEFARIFAHPQAFAQCELWLGKKRPAGGACVVREQLGGGRTGGGMRRGGDSPAFGGGDF